MYILPKILLLATFAALSLFVTANAQSFGSASTQAKQDLDSALEELKMTRETIATDKIPLIRSVSTLESEVREKQSELDRLRRLRDNSDLGLNRLRDHRGIWHHIQNSANRAEAVMISNLNAHRVPLHGAANSLG